MRRPFSGTPLTVMRNVAGSLSAKGGIENPPEMEGTLPKGWIYRATEQGIRIKKDVGFGILIR